MLLSRNLRKNCPEAGEHISGKQIPPFFYVRRVAIRRSDLQISKLLSPAGS